MVDIVPELLEAIQAEYAEGVSKSGKLKKIKKKIDSGKGDYPDADDYAEELSRILLSAYEDYLTEENLPGGILYYNIAKRIIEPTIKQAYSDAAQIAAQVQDGINKKAKIGIKALVPELEQTRIDGLIEKILEKWTAARSVSAV